MAGYWLLSSGISEKEGGGEVLLTGNRSDIGERVRGDLA